jgi:hypothetical protein
VIAWLDDAFANQPSFTEELPLYKAAFTEQGVDGLTLCGLAKDELRELGVDKAVHRAKLFNGWRALVDASACTADDSLAAVQ